MKIGISFPIGTNNLNIETKVADLREYHSIGAKYLDISLPNLLPFLQNEPTISKVGEFILNNPLGFLYTTHGRYNFNKNFNQSIETDQAINDINISSKIGATNINFHLPYCVSFQRLSKSEAMVFAAFLEEIIQYSTKQGITSSWENTVALKIVDGQWVFDQRIEDLDYEYNLKTLEDIIGIQVPLTFDTGHYAVMRDNPTQSCINFISKYKSQLKMFHIHDNNGLSDKHYFPKLKEGVINWASVNSVLSTFDVPVILEIDRDFSKSEASRSLNFLIAQ